MSSAKFRHIQKKKKFAEYGTIYTQEYLSKVNCTLFYCVPCGRCELSVPFSAAHLDSPWTAIMGLYTEACAIEGIN